MRARRLSPEGLLALLVLAVAREASPPLAVAAALVGVFAIFHGHAHGTELPPGQSGLLTASASSSRRGACI